MSKTITLHQIMDVEEIIQEVKVGGTVTKSNFLEEGERHLFPIHKEVLDMIKEGDKIKVTFYSTNTDVERTEKGYLKFKSNGIKYDLWNNANDGWDRIFEEMKPPEADS